MKLLVRVAVLLTALIAGLAGAGALLVRANRGRHDRPVEIAVGLAAVRGGGVWLFAARAGREVLLFDTGADPKGRPVDALLRALRAVRSEVKHVFLTHGHFENAAALNLLPSSLVHAGAADVDLVAGLAPPDSTAGRLFAALMQVPPARVSEALVGEMEIPLEEGPAVLALPLPGHTDGSYAYLYRGILFAGDALGDRYGGLGFLPGLVDAHPEQKRAAIAALARRLANVPFDRICTSHEGCTPPGSGPALLRRYAEGDRSL